MFLKKHVGAFLGPCCLGVGFVASFLVGCSSLWPHEQFVLGDSRGFYELSAYDCRKPVLFFDGSVSLIKGRRYVLESVNSSGVVVSSESVSACAGGSFNLIFSQNQESRQSLLYWHWSGVGAKCKIKQCEASVGDGVLHRQEMSSGGRDYSVFNAPLGSFMVINSGRCGLVSFCINGPSGDECGRFVLRRLN